MAPNTKGIFISYRREESAGHAGRIRDNLSDHFGEDRIFQDIVSIEPGEDFAEAIDRAVDSSGVLLAVIDRNWAATDDPDDYVRREIATALKRNVPVMPLRIQGAAMPRAAELPDDLAPLARLNAIELHESVWREQIPKLITTLDKVLRREPVDDNREPEAEIERLREAEIERLSSQIRMVISNRRITSREYKLMLNVDRFKDREQASQEFLSLLDFLVRKARGRIVEEQNEEVRRSVSYLDTPEGALHQQGVALRLREEGDEEGFQINLKYRASDRYISAAQDLSSPQEGKTKFEEDILPPFISKFSHSTSIETDTDPELGSMHKVTALFPGLKGLNLGERTAVKAVNDFKALEVVRNLCKLEFGEEPIIKARLSFWYLIGQENEWPLVGEFSFDYDVLDSEADEDKLEIYPRQMVEGANRLFNALQKQEGWLSFSTTTKTAFALEGL